MSAAHQFLIIGMSFAGANHLDAARSRLLKGLKGLNSFLRLFLILFSLFFANLNMRSFKKPFKLFKPFKITLS